MVTPGIRVLFFEGCPNAQPTIELIQSILARRGIAVAVEPVQVDDPDQAARLKFLGSPTVQINGIDIEEQRREDSPFFGCRLYRHNGEARGVPPAELIEAALAQALG